jgi:hypothetical protein
MCLSRRCSCSDRGCSESDEMYSLLPVHRTSECVLERVSVRTPVSSHVCVAVSSLKMWKSWLAVCHMFAHQIPSLCHSTLSARLMPVGVPVPVWTAPSMPTSAVAALGTDAHASAISGRHSRRTSAAGVRLRPFEHPRRDLRDRSTACSCARTALSVTILAPPTQSVAPATRFRALLRGRSTAACGHALRPRRWVQWPGFPIRRSSPLSTVTTRTAAVRVDRPLPLQTVRCHARLAIDRGARPRRVR